MTGSANERHNQVAREALVVILRGVSNDEVEAMIIVESVVFGLLTHFRPKPSEATEFLDLMTERIVTRIHSNGESK